MKIDLYNNHDEFIKEQRQDSLLDRFCLKKGIRRKDLQSHPHWQDLALLINMYSEFSKEMKCNKSLISTYNAYWGIVYKQKLALRNKALVKLEILTEQCIKIRQQQQAKIDKIKSLRTGSATNNNIDHDNKANGSCLPRVTNTKREQQECRAVPERVWEAHELW
jgi:hypothetical protein